MMKLQVSRICRDCRFYRPNTGSCVHPISKTVDIVTGNERFKSALEMRFSEEMCGREATLYEEENPVAKAARSVNIGHTMVMFAFSLYATMIVAMVRASST